MAEAQAARSASTGGLGVPLCWGCGSASSSQPFPQLSPPAPWGRTQGQRRTREDWVQRLSCGSGGDRRFRAGRRRVIGGDQRWGARCHPRGEPMRPAGTGRGGAGGTAVSHPGRREGPGCPGRGSCWAWEAVQALQGGEARRARLWLCPVSLTLLPRVRPEAPPQAPQPLKGVLTHWAG